jgi:hypothetical protein
MHSFTSALDGEGHLKTFCVLRFPFDAPFRGRQTDGCFSMIFFL